MTNNASKTRSISRISFYALCALNYITLLLIGDVFLVDVLQYAGFHDGAIGIINSAAGFVSFVQIFLIFMGHKIRNQKAIILFGFTNLSAMCALAYVIALMPAGQPLRQVLIVACLMVGRLVFTFASPVLDTFKYSFISLKERGVVQATNSTVSLAVAIVASLVLGKIRDYYRDTGNMAQGLLVTGLFLCVITVLTVISVVLMRSSEEQQSTPPPKGIRDILRNTLFSKSFLCMLLFYILWSTAYTITTSFVGVYKINELQFNLSTIQIINTISNIVAMLLARPFGKLADRKTHSLCLKYSLMIHVAAFTILAFTAPETSWFLCLYSILSGFAGMVLSACFFNLLLEYTGQTYYMYGIALITCISGVFGFVLSFAAAWLLELIQSMGNTLFGITVYAQQILSAISAVMTLGLLGYAHFVITKLPRHSLKTTSND